MANKMRIALLQLLTRETPEKCLQQAAKCINQAVSKGAQMVVLPELFTTELHPPIILANREHIPGPTSTLMSELAKKHKIHVVAGSIPEFVNEDRLLNTCSVFDPTGKIVAQHRKMHMFDVELGPRLCIRESEISDSGNSLTTFETDKCKVGLGICIDIRYPEVSRLYTERGCKLQLFLGAFSALKTGPAHWEVIQRARAIDNQVFVATCAPARDDSAHYSSWGHSMVIDPWGEKLASAGEDEEVVIADIDFDRIDVVRNQLPTDKIRRKDLFRVEYTGD